MSWLWKKKWSCCIATFIHPTCERHIGNLISFISTTSWVSDFEIDHDRLFLYYKTLRLHGDLTINSLTERFLVRKMQKIPVVAKYKIGFNIVLFIPCVGCVTHTWTLNLAFKNVIKILVLMHGLELSCDPLTEENLFFYHKWPPKAQIRLYMHVIYRSLY